MLQKQRGQIKSSPRLRLVGRRTAPHPTDSPEVWGPKSATGRKYSEYRGRRESGGGAIGRAARGKMGTRGEACSLRLGSHTSSPTAPPCQAQPGPSSSWKSFYTLPEELRFSFLSVPIQALWNKAGACAHLQLRSDIPQERLGWVDKQNE